MSVPTPPRTLAERLRTWRNRRIASPRFQAWAARFPLTRPIARAQASGLFDLVAGFVYSQVLAACVELDLLPMLAEGPQSVDTIATRTRLDHAASERLLKAAASLGLARKTGTRFMLGQRGAALLGNPGALAMVRHHALLYADLANPVGLLRGERGPGALAAYWPYARAARPEAAAAGEVAQYSALMAASQPMIAEQVLAAYRFDRHRQLMDVGGGAGAFLIAVGARYPALALRAFDLPAVAEVARAAMVESGLGARADAIGGDMFEGALPVGADVVSLVRVLHDHDDSAAMSLLRRICAILPQGGTLLIAEPMAGTRGAQAMGDAYFGLYLLAMGSGRARSPAEIAAMCLAAGFRSARLRATPLPMIARLIVAKA